MPHARASLPGNHSAVRRSPSRSLAAVLALVLGLAACAPATPPTAEPATVAPTTGATAEDTAAATAAASLSGAWDGALVDPSGSYPVHLVLDRCSTVGAACGEMEYLDPGGADTVLCASELTLTATAGDQFSFSERYVYRGWLCLPSTFGMTHSANGGLAVEQFVQPEVVCCRGTFEVAAGAAAAPEIPASLGVLGQATSAAALGGATTQYPTAGAGSLWFPLEDLGAVARVDPATGAVTALIPTGDPGSLPGMKSDPHAVVAGDAGIWVAQAAGHTIGRIDPATNVVTDTIALPITPYALALDGTTLWATSFEDDRVVRVDLASGKVAAEISVSKPTGIAIGLGGVWVVRHRDDVLVRIDPETDTVVAEIGLGNRGPSEVCGMCVENVVIADGSVWTANNEGRSVSRINAKTNKVTKTIDLPLRPWSVTAGGGQIWASQFEARPDGSFGDQSTWGVARIDPATNEAASLGLPGALSVFWAGDALWVVSPWRRGDVVIRVETSAP